MAEENKEKAEKLPEEKPKEGKTEAVPEGEKKEPKEEKKEEAKPMAAKAREIVERKGERAIRPKKSKKRTDIEWVEYSKEEATDIVKKLANEGHPKSEIGMILRDQHGIPKFRALTGMKISQVLKEANLHEEMPEALLNLIKKSVKINEHLAKNPKDYTCKRGYELTASKIRRLVSYYKKKGILPKEWRFSDETARLLVK